MKSRRPAPAIQAVVMVLVLLAVCGLLFLVGLDSRALWDPHESLRAEAARQALASGRYLAPGLSGVPLGELPPMAVWLRAASLAGLGVGELAARLPGALWAFLLVILCFILGRAQGGNLSGLMAGLVCATSLGLPLAARGLAGTVAGAAGLVWALFGAWRAGPGKPAGAYWFWIACAVLLLVRGPAALVLLAAVLVLFSLIGGGWWFWRDLLRWPALLCGLLLPLAWLAAAALHNPAYVPAFGQAQLRLLLPAGASGAWLPILVGLLPWAPLAPWAICQGGLSAWQGEAGRPRLLAASLLAVSLTAGLFTPLGRELAGALLAAAWGLLLGPRLQQTLASGIGSTRPGQAAGLKALAVLLVAAAAALALGPLYSTGQGSAFWGWRLLAAPAALALLALAIFVGQGLAWAAVWQPMALGALLVGGIGLLAPAWDQSRSAKGLLTPLGLRPRDRVQAVAMAPWGLGFYARRPVARWQGGAAGRARLAAGGRVFLAGPEPALKALRQRLARRQGPRLYLWHSTGGRQVLCNRRPP